MEMMRLANAYTVAKQRLTIFTAKRNGTMRSLKRAILSSSMHSQPGAVPAKLSLLKSSSKSVQHATPPSRIQSWTSADTPPNRFSDKYPTAKFFKLDVDEVPDTAQELGIRAMPTFLLFKDGEKVAEVVGANPKALEAAIQKGLE
jgi:hypothetical protein